MSNADEKPLVGHEPSSTLAVPEKAALSNVSSVSTPIKCKSIRSSAESTPRADLTENPFDTDLEAMIPTDSSPPGCVRRETTHKSDCQVWPGTADWKQKARESKAARTRKRFNCLAGLSRRNRIIAKIIIVLLIIGVAVSVGFGVSKPLGAPIWGDHR
jgi:hypothetical protein